MARRNIDRQFDIWDYAAKPAGFYGDAVKARKYF
jgi:hypothetical protein